MTKIVLLKLAALKSNLSNWINQLLLILGLLVVMYSVGSAVLLALKFLF
jgi:hypothetical protein